MARIRSIKPEFWTSAQVLECSTNARLLFLGTWNFADDAGRHPWSAKQLKAEIFPADDFTEAQMLQWMGELVTHGLIERYQSDGKEYFYITGWKHQRIDKPQAAKYPDPFDDNSKIIPGTIPPDTIRSDTIGNDHSRAVADATRPVKNFEFEEFWKVYPKRQGANPKHPARKKFEACVKSGVSAETIIGAARKYADDERALGHISTPYVAQAVTWLNQQRFQDYVRDGPEIERQAELEQQMAAKGWHWNGQQWAKNEDAGDVPRETMSH